MELEFVQQNIILFIALVVVIGLLLMDPIRKRISGIKDLSSSQLPRLMSDEDVVILDVSEESEFKKGHIVDAINIPMKSLAEKMDSLKKHQSKTVVVTCPTGNKANRAATDLRKAGFSKVYSLKEGIAGWVRDNMPVERA